MKLEVIRYQFGEHATMGMLIINGKFNCYTLEDTNRKKKQAGITCIPDGEYNVALRPVGGFYQRFLAKYGSLVKPGMLHVENVPNFEYILIHPGNYPKNTEGCLLLGQTSAPLTPMIGSSVNAWKPAYLEISKALIDGEKVIIEYKPLTPESERFYD